MASRRTFIKTSVLTGIGAVAFPATGNAASLHQPKSMSQFYELRVYSFNDDAQQKIVGAYLQNALIPALNHLGINGIGVFTELKPQGLTKIYVLIPFNAIIDFANLGINLDKDAIYARQGAPYLNAPAVSPAYNRIESSLLQAFAHMPKIELPGKSPRIFELRQYQSAGERAGKKKIEMFNDQGEISIFKRLGFKPVFYAETLIGALRPNLTYMLTFDDMAAHDSHWKAFGSDPEWKKISAVPAYADAELVSKITSVFLVPTVYSQV